MAISPGLRSLYHWAERYSPESQTSRSSAFSGEGKTLTATNLALTLSESYQKTVLLIDADVRRPAVQASRHSAIWLASSEPIVPPVYITKTPRASFAAIIKYS